MNRIHLAAWAVGFALLVSGCERAATPEPFPQDVADGWIAAFNSGDVDGLSLMYTPDAEILPPDTPIVAGHDAIVEFWKDYNPGAVRIALSNVETFPAGKYWLREGAYSAKFPEEGEPRLGKFMELWAKVGNVWLLHRQMWSQNSPSPAQMPGAGSG